MKIICPLENIEPLENQPVVALLGPVPRSAETAVLNWHSAAISILKSAGYKGTVLVPVPRGCSYYNMSDVEDDEYMEKQMAWDREMFEAVENAGEKGVFAFWVPRNQHMLAEFTEKEFYELLPKHPDRIVMGIPVYAENVDNMHNYCQNMNLRVHATLYSWAINVVGTVGLEPQGYVSGDDLISDPNYFAHNIK